MYISYSELIETAMPVHCNVTVYIVRTSVYRPIQWYRAAEGLFCRRCADY